MSAQGWRRWWRSATLQFAIAALGVLAIVGSGGGGVGESGPSVCPLIPCGVPGGSGAPVTPVVSASVAPAYVTVMAGLQVTYTVTVYSGPAGITFQWSRSSDGGATFVDIAGATAPTYQVNGATPADDGAIFRITVRAPDAIPAFAHGRLAVSPAPGVVFQDGEFVPSDWLVSPLIDATHLSFAHSEERVPTGGNPGAYWRMTAQVPQGASSIAVFYASLRSVYDPAASGAINVIDYAEDCNKTSADGYATSQLVLEQAGRRYLPGRLSAGGTCLGPVWSSGPAVSSLRQHEFELFDGPPCNVGEACPDFSATGKPLRFGYRRESFRTGDTVVHGIDNWTVTVWRK